MKAIAGYLKNKKKFAKYRVVAAFDLNTNDYPRNDKGMIDPSYDDLYIKCRQGNQIYHYGRSTLVAYVPSLQRGRNILNKIDDKIPTYIEETASEVIFHFDFKYLDTVAELLKAFTNRKNENGEYHYISPFSTKNLPKTKYKIPDEDLKAYREIIKTIPPSDTFKIASITKDFMKDYIVRRGLSMNDLKADMKKLCLKGKAYIHSRGLWREYIEYLKKGI